MMMYDLNEIRFMARVNALGAEATENQLNDLVAWTVENIPRDQWMWAADLAATLIPGFYTEMTMRLGEFGQ
jgi:hypothetical protein